MSFFPVPLMYGGLKAILLRSAEVMPEENYGFKPTDTVRSFGQVGHVAPIQLRIVLTRRRATARG